jgi:hypothetical protein
MGSPSVSAMCLAGTPELRNGFSSIADRPSLTPSCGVFGGPLLDQNSESLRRVRLPLRLRRFSQVKHAIPVVSTSKLCRRESVRQFFRLFPHVGMYRSQKHGEEIHTGWSELARRPEIVNPCFCYNFRSRRKLQQSGGRTKSTFTSPRMSPSSSEARRVNLSFFHSEWSASENVIPRTWRFT